MKWLTSIYMIFTFLFSANVSAHATFSQKYCQKPGYYCYKVKSGESWATLFPDPNQRIVVKKLNRMNVPLLRGYTIAIPKNLDNGINHMDVAPLPQHIGHQGQSIVKVDLSKLAWGAYDASGRLINWGPVAGGKDYCPDVKRGCRTIVGRYTFYRKQGPGCISSKFPRPNGGAPMPYCMHFKGGYAMHASETVPGHHASHGCVRMFYEDAQWLNQNFVQSGRTKVEITR